MRINIKHTAVIAQKNHLILRGRIRGVDCCRFLYLEEPWSDLDKRSSVWQRFKPSFYLKNDSLKWIFNSCFRWDWVTAGSAAKPQSVNKRGNCESGFFSVQWNVLHGEMFHPRRFEQLELRPEKHVGRFKVFIAVQSRVDTSAPIKVMLFSFTNQNTEEHSDRGQPSNYQQME